MKFTLKDYILMAMMASLGIAVKVIVVPLAHMITGPLFIPGGVVAGGIYMAFIVLTNAIIKKRWTCTMVALIQGIVVTITGTLGSHGAASIFTYALPGLAIDLILLLFNVKSYGIVCCFVSGIIANMVGSFAVNLAIFNLSLIPLLLSLITSALSGGLGGVLAYYIATSVNHIFDEKISGTFVDIPKE